MEMLHQILCSLWLNQANMMGQIFVNDVDFIHFIPIHTKSEAGDTLAEFIRDIGIPSALHTDEMKELTLGLQVNYMINKETV